MYAPQPRAPKVFRHISALLSPSVQIVLDLFVLLLFFFFFFLFQMLSVVHTSIRVTYCRRSPITSITQVYSSILTYLSSPLLSSPLLSSPLLSSHTPLPPHIARHLSTPLVAEWKASPGSFVGPYFAVCQSSGYGKTRMISEVKENGRRRWGGGGWRGVSEEYKLPPPPPPPPLIPSGRHLKDRTCIHSTSH